MRLLLVFLALLSGLSLSEVAVASSRAEVVSAASGSVLVAKQEQKACTGDILAQKPTAQTRLAEAAPLPKPAHIRVCSIRLPDRPRE